MKALDVESVGEFLARASTGWILGAVEVGAVFWLVYAYALPPAIAAILATALAVFVGLVVLLTFARKRWRSARLAVTTRTMEELLSLETTQAFGRPSLTDEQVDAHLSAYHRRATAMDAFSTAVAVLPGVMLLTTLLSVFLSAGTGGAGVMAVSLGAVLLASSGMERLSAVSIDTVAMIDARWGLRDLDRFRPPPAEAASIDASFPPSSDPAILLRAHQITATFDAGQGLVKPVDLTLREGDRLLISAPSGHGKTTLGEVLAGERKISSGSIHLREGLVIARVLQADDDHMFANSLLFNIAAGVGWPVPSDIHGRVEELLEELGLVDLLTAMPAGLAQPIGEGGWSLSTGERTRISVAAALLKEPDILILDESISTLDGEARELVLAACTRHSKATVMFAHWD